MKRKPPGSVPGGFFRRAGFREGSDGVLCVSIECANCRAATVVSGVISNRRLIVFERVLRRALDRRKGGHGACGFTDHSGHRSGLGQYGLGCDRTGRFAFDVPRVRLYFHACAHNGLAVGEFTPRQIKLAVVGEGTADKVQVQYMVRQILGLEDLPRPDHAADALAAAICYVTHGDMR